MTSSVAFQMAIGASILLLLAGLFSLYQNPVFEMYLATWSLC